MIGGKETRKERTEGERKEGRKEDAQERKLKMERKCGCSSKKLKRIIEEGKK